MRVSHTQGDKLQDSIETVPEFPGIICFVHTEILTTYTALIPLSFLCYAIFHTENKYRFST